LQCPENQIDSGKYRLCDNQTSPHQAVITQSVAAALAAIAVLYICTPASVKICERQQHQQHPYHVLSSSVRSCPNRSYDAEEADCQRQERIVQKMQRRMRFSSSNSRSNSRTRKRTTKQRGERNEDKKGTRTSFLRFSKRMGKTHKLRTMLSWHLDNKLHPKTASSSTTSLDPS